LKITDSTAPLAAYPEATGSFFDTATYVNSTRVLNAIKSGLTAVPNYRKAAIKRTGVAVTLDLSSRTWAFDIVPSVEVADSYLLKKRGPGRQGRRGGVAGGRLKHDAEGLPWN